MRSLFVFFSGILLCLTAPAPQGFAQQSVTPATALQAYLSNGDESFQWQVRDSFQIDNVKGYNLLVTSQKWRQYMWRHQLIVLVPAEVAHEGALLFITGGSNKDEQPNWKKNDDGLIKPLAQIATQNKAITTILRQTPNQPLYGDLTEDQLISYTLHQFKKDGDYTWPLLFPMVKSAVRSMDAVQEFSKKIVQKPISTFVVAGASKRGWTTWLTGANDPRVTAIGPMVIDVLNMPVSLNYQLEVWNDYSVQIEDYVKLGIPQGAETESGKAINTMIDPYSYRKALTMPKMIFIGTNDEYWPVDAIKHYYDDIPGKNMIHYVPNAGHDLGGGEQAFRALGAFWATTLQKQPYPTNSWTLKKQKDGVLVKIKSTPDQLIDAIVWSATSEDRDFRNETFTSQSLGVKATTYVETLQKLPTSGYKAFYIDLKYKSLIGTEYTVSTRVFVANSSGVL
ncbi:PhoPQ-activated pathogenicity-related family protein [Arundinibacter roseus]|uniref:PhoPQ-activated pathogenicity-like protein PqaA type n=1 Tax=Arundinibacter roseus TaxID=2070510 RepID=A0A4R4K5M5_9BACT|nr:PhoPQ-activated protein PqaA family protein [Arundinibacter roseus]TDB61771.1 PhoPQ-activated pathogenicity-like protein PqaA type [Arundinibacter roseus]